MKKVGLILEGGGTKGIFTAGALDYLQSSHISLPYVVSVSIGTCNAVNYLSKQRGRTKECLIPNRQRTPLIHWKHLVKKKTWIDVDRIFADEETPFDYEMYRNSNIQSEYVVTNCLTGKAEYLAEKSNCKRLQSICLASCSVPYISSITMVDGIPYLDGGISDAIPIRHAIELGYEKNIVVLLKERGYRERDSASLKALSRVFYHKYPNLIEALDHRISSYNESLCYLERLEKEGKVLILSPDKVLIGRASNNVCRMKEFYQQGYALVKRRENEIRKFIN